MSEPEAEAAPPPDPVPVFAVSTGALTVGTLEEHARRPLLDRGASVWVEVATGQPWVSQVLSRVFLGPDERERMAIALAPWLCPIYAAWEDRLPDHEGSPPVGHGREGACVYPSCRSVTTKAMAS